MHHIISRLLHPHILRSPHSKQERRQAADNERTLHLSLSQQKAAASKQSIEEVLSGFKIGIIGAGIVGKSILNALTYLFGNRQAVHLYLPSSLLFLPALRMDGSF